jgi:protein-S-isoprenylcysteine O-methyltransferase Ste14
MKNTIKIICLIIISIILVWDFNAFAEIKWLWNIINKNPTQINATWDISNDLENVWFNILWVIKYLLSWLLLIMIVYIWWKMILSRWSNEEDLNSSKKSLRYMLVWLVFINIPWTLYEAFNTTKWQSIDASINNNWSLFQNKNFLINSTSFTNTLNDWIIQFIEITIFSIAILFIILAWLSIMKSRWREEEITEAKNKIVWSLIWLIFVWFIETWNNLIFNWKVTDWANMFATIENLALFFVWPIWIFFVSLAWYYLITSWWDEEKVTKAKNIIINTILATLILLASHTFLKDLFDLTF